MLRVTGRVVKIDDRRGSKTNEDSGEVTPWVMDLARVLVGGVDIVEVTHFRKPTEEPFKGLGLAVGQEIDLAVEISNGRGGRPPSISVEQTWSQLVGEQPAASTGRRSAEAAA